MSFTPSCLSWLQAILKERFGHFFMLTLHEQKLVLSLPETNGSIVFDMLQPAFHQSRSDAPCAVWDAQAEGWESVMSKPLPAPAVDTLPSPLLECQSVDYLIHYDILGLVYWALSRLEEVGRKDLDSHGRFPAVSSHAFQYNYLERPIIDEWLHLLGQVILRQWPHLKLVEHDFSMKVSHDVDRPARYGFQGVTGLIRAVGGDLFKRKDLKSLFFGFWIFITSRKKLHPKDPYNTFDWIMDLSERNGLTSAFYFICGRTDVNKDADYEPEDIAIRKLIRRIYNRGHEIGLHPSYNSYQTPAIVIEEVQRLQRVCLEEGVHQDKWGGRMHYLRWEHPTTMQAWSDAGMTYDSTLGYADRPGFRCGTCFEYPAFNPSTQQALTLRIRPLIAMECTVISELYMGIDNDKTALDKFLELKHACKVVGGCFTLLWHNSVFVSDSHKKIYEQILSCK